MKINNDVRRLKAKLKLFEEEGFNWVVADILDIYNGNGTGRDAPEFVNDLKLKYLEQLASLLPTDNKQGKLEL